LEWKGASREIAINMCGPSTQLACHGTSGKTTTKTTIKTTVYLVADGWEIQLINCPLDGARGKQFASGRTSLKNKPSVQCGLHRFARGHNYHASGKTKASINLWSTSEQKTRLALLHKQQKKQQNIQSTCCAAWQKENKTCATSHAAEKVTKESQSGDEIEKEGYKHKKTIVPTAKDNNQPCIGQPGKRSAREYMKRQYSHKLVKDKNITINLSRQGRGEQ